MRNNLFYDNMPAELRSEFQLGAEQYGVEPEVELIEEAPAPKTYSGEVTEVAEQFNKDLEAMGYFDAIELYNGR